MLGREVEYGTCHCGCGERTTVPTATDRRLNRVKGVPMRYIQGHHHRGRTGSRNNAWRGGRKRHNKGYIVVHQPGHPRATSDGYVLEHILVAEKAFGGPLPPGAVVHHFNENKADNRPENLVICPDEAYHKLLHRRQRAVAACGSPDWGRCWRCKQWDAPTALISSGGSVAHPECHRKYWRERAANRRN